MKVFTMKITIFFIEIIIIFFYMTWDDPDSFIKMPKEKYDTYYSSDSIGNKILKFPINTTKEEKLNSIKKSELIQEIAEYSTNIEAMIEIFNNGVEDQTQFKQDFTAYLEAIHFEYIGGNLTHKELKKLIINPTNI